MGLWGGDKPDSKLKGGHGVGWLRCPHRQKVVRIASAGETLHAKWVEVVDADLGSDGKPLVRRTRRMLRFNGEQLWHNLIRQGWKRVPPQW